MTEHHLTAIALGIVVLFTWQSILLLRQEAALDRLDDASAEITAIIHQSAVSP